MKNTCIWIAWIGAAILGLAMSAAAADLSGENLLRDRCARCHNIDKSVKAKKTTAQWKVTVDRMIGKGAKLNADEKQALIDYLSKMGKDI